MNIKKDRPGEALIIIREVQAGDLEGGKSLSFWPMTLVEISFSIIPFVHLCMHFSVKLCDTVRKLFHRASQRNAHRVTQRLRVLNIKKDRPGEALIREV